MTDAAREFLDALLTTPGASGFEEPIQRVVREYAKEFADVSTDYHGNVTAAVNAAGGNAANGNAANGNAAGGGAAGDDGRIRVMLAGHCDQIALMVRNIDEQGFLRVGAMGGWDVQTLIGQAMDVWTKDGPLPGVIARKAIHLLSSDERKQVPEVKDLWVDIGVQGRGEAKELVRIGDPVTLRLGPRAMRNNLVAGPAMDDRVGVWVVMEAARRAALRDPSAAVFAVSTVQEEIGLRGARTAAYRIDPHVGIAVDVTHATDCPSIDRNEHGAVGLGDGPVIFRGPNVNNPLFARLTDLADDRDLPYQIGALPRAASNDGNAIQLTRGGPATGIVGIPNRYMHSPVEMVSLDDLDAAADLIAEFCATVTPDHDFTPR